MEENKVVQMDASVGDAARSKVPMSRRLGVLSNSMVMAGFVIVISSLMVGGTVGMNFAPKTAVLIMLFASLSNSFVAILIGSIGARTGYSSAMIYRFSYGKKGTIIPNVIMAFTGMGWFSVIAATTRDSVVEYFGIATGSALSGLIFILLMLLFVAPAFKSIKWMGYVNYVAVPALFIIIMYVAIRVINISGGLSELLAIEMAPTMAIGMGMSSAAGGWLQGATVSPDFTRFCKDGKQAGWAMAISFGVLVFIQFAAASFGAIVLGDWNIFAMLNALGVGVIAFIAVFLGAWSTGQGIIYGASLQIAAPPNKIVKNQEYTRRLWLAILWILGCIIAFLGLHDIINAWLGILGNLITPIAITVLLDYWAFPERQKLYESTKGPDMNVNPAAAVAYVAGVITGFWSNANGFFIPVLNMMIVSGVIYYIWMRIALNKGNNPEALLKK